MKINLHWRGPHSYSEVREMDGDTDYGLYQIYYVHPVYGDTLVYIGKAGEQTFATRLGQSEYRWMGDDHLTLWEDNGRRIRFHTGRIHVQQNENPPGDATWNDWIVRAEHLLISAHSPAWNATYVRTPPRDPVYHDVHVLNWGQHARLLPEVSGARFTNDAVFTRLNDDPVGSSLGAGKMRAATHAESFPPSA